MLETLEGRGARTEVLAEGVDEHGAWIRFRHTVWGRGATAGPHWHPVLAERFTVVAGALVITLDGDRHTVLPGGIAEVSARTVHAFTQVVPEAGETVVEHEIRPPGRHRAMFQVLAALEATGRLTRLGLPRDPRALGLLWELQDGYLAGPPPRLQHLVLGGFARLARATGYHRRLATAVGRDPEAWSASAVPDMATPPSGHPAE